MMKKEVLLACIAVGSLTLAMANSVFAEMPKVEILIDKLMKAGGGIIVKTSWPSKTRLYDVRPLIVFLENDVLYKKNCIERSGFGLLDLDCRICRYKSLRDKDEITDVIFVNSENDDCETLFKNFMRIDSYGFVESDPDKLK